MIKHLNSSPKQVQRVAILGASGFVAKSLNQYLLENNYQGRCIAIPSAEADLTKRESATILRKMIVPTDTVVICSAVTPDKGRDVRTQMQNIKMGETLAEFFESSLCAHVIYISSDAVYSDNANPVEELSPCDPSSFYGLTHLVRERMLADVLKRSKIPFLILRPAALYGAEDTHNSYGPNRFVRTAIEQKKISLFGGGEEKRDHVYVKDLCRLICQCVEQRSEGILNVATGKSISFYDLASLVAKVLQERIEIVTSVRQNPVTHRHFNITALIEAFPFFSCAPLSEGITQMLGAMAQKK